MDIENVAIKPMLFVQLNDLYHIDASADYTRESLLLPRIKILVDRVRSHLGRDRVIFCLPGDFLAPSYLGKVFKGAQMVDILNSMRMDLVTFGNHEFEKQFKTEDVLQRIRESRFKWLSSNFEFFGEGTNEKLEEQGHLLPEARRLTENHLVIVFGVMAAESFEHIGVAHSPVRFAKMSIGIFSDLAVDRVAKNGRPIRVSFVALTHQTLASDKSLARRCPDLRLIMGGHDHNVVKQEQVGKCMIVKTASNARTLRLNWMVSVTPRGGFVLPERTRDPEAYKDLVYKVVGQTLKDALQHIFLGKPNSSKRKDRQAVVDFQSLFIKSGRIDSGVTIKTQKFDDELLITFSTVIDTIDNAFIRLVPPSKSLSRRIHHWIERGGASVEPIAISPVKLCVSDSAMRRRSLNFGNLAADIVRGRYFL